MKIYDIFLLTCSLAAALAWKAAFCGQASDRSFVVDLLNGRRPLVPMVGYFQTGSFGSIKAGSSAVAGCGSIGIYLQEEIKNLTTFLNVDSTLWSG